MGDLGDKTRLHKHNSEQALDRLFEFYNRRMQDQILAHIWVPVPNPVVENEPQDPEADVVKERDPVSWKRPHLMLEGMRAYVRSVASRENYDDRTVPSCSPAHGFEGGLETVMLGGKVKWIGTLYHTYGVPEEPLIKNYDEFDWRLPSEDNIWLQRFLDSFRYMVERANGEFAVNYVCVIDAMNLAVQLRGTEQAYLDMYDHPDELHRLMEWGYELNKYLYDRAMAILKPYNDSLYGEHPIKKYSSVPAMSVDAYSLCASGALSKWGLDQLSRFSTYTGGGNFHIHENGRQVIEEFVKIKDVMNCHFSDGAGYPRTFDMRWDIRRRMQDVPMSIACSKDELIQGLRQRDLPGNTMYGSYGGTIEEAREIMKMVRDYRAPAI